MVEVWLTSHRGHKTKHKTNLTELETTEREFLSYIKKT